MRIQSGQIIMKRLIVSVLIVCLLVSGCGNTPVVSADSLEGRTVALTEAVRVSFQLGKEKSVESPFTLEITKSGIEVKYMNGTVQELIISIYAKEENVDIAEARLSKNNPIVKFSNLRAARTYYLVIQKDESQTGDVVLEICQFSS